MRGRGGLFCIGFYAASKRQANICTAVTVIVGTIFMSYRPVDLVAVNVDELLLLLRLTLGPFYCCFMMLRWDENA